MNKLSEHVAIVTGGSRGIGKSIAAALAAEGARVVICSRSAAALKETAGELTKDGNEVFARTADVTSEEDIRGLVGFTIGKFGRIDILVNNAGVGFFKRAVEMEAGEFDTMWRVNVRGPFLAAKTVLPHMMKARAGAIVNIASLAGKNSFVGGTGYAATKWALRGWAGSLMLEVRESNIRVVTIFPGSVETEFSSGGKRGANITQPEDVSAAVVFAVTAPARSMFSEIDVRPTNPK